MLEKILISDEEGDIHYLKEPFLVGRSVLCGKKLTLTACVRVKDEHAVSCEKCLDLKAYDDYLEVLDISGKRVAVMFTLMRPSYEEFSRWPEIRRSHPASILDFAESKFGKKYLSSFK